LELSRKFFFTFSNNCFTITDDELPTSKQNTAPLSMDTWEEKMDFLKSIHTEIDRKKKLGYIYEVFSDEPLSD
jgi:hypothetical protein